jgi:uncharacterized membrane protein YtjA (UPF0391 family)
MNNKGVGGWLMWAIIFLVIALVAGVFGFGLISGVSLTIAKWLAVIFVILFIINCPSLPAYYCCKVSPSVMSIVIVVAKLD